jgi:hypothetical protein
LRETPLLPKRLYPISEQTAGCLWQDAVDFSCYTSNCLFVYSSHGFSRLMVIEGSQSDHVSRRHQPLPQTRENHVESLSPPPGPQSSHRR